MRIAILGAGPAGLYLAALVARWRPDATVDVFEQNAPGATFGFGVVFSDRALEFLGRDDGATLAALQPHLETWSDIALDHAGRRIAIDGVGFAAIGRLKLLEVLQAGARAAGVQPVYGRTIASLDELGPADLIVGADGVNSLVRRTCAEALGARVEPMSNRFAWFGTPARFETLTQTFRQTADGAFNAHHYRYAADMSTFIVECDAATFERAGLARLDEESSRKFCETVFADTLAGAPLIANRSLWRQFPIVRTARWSARWSACNAVVIGDAAHTAHFSIGSGTRLALEDALALATCIAAEADVPGALARYEATRRPIVEKLTAAADASADWYEAFATHMALPPMDFAMSYIARSGRVDLERLRRISPDFVAAWERERREG